jgi:hypothetical protein
MSEHPSNERRHRRLARALAALAAGAALLAGALVAAPAASATSWGGVDPKHPDFGPNVTIYSPSTPVSQIQSELSALADQQRSAQFSTTRKAVYFLPGTYGTPDAPLNIELGYNTELAGLGANPDDVTINGTVNVYNQCLTASNCLALVNFWRSMSNLAIHVSMPNAGCRTNTEFWAVSQGTSMRRVDVTGGGMSLMDYCTAGPQYASGGFIADSNLPSTVNGSQQQWLVRNSVLAGWSNGVWNQVFSGVTGAPDDSTFPTNTYTTIPQTPVSREKPYLHVDANGNYLVRVPSAQKNSSGTTWANGATTPGRDIPIQDFYIAKPGDSALKIDAALALGKNLIFTPGVYNIDRSILVWRPDTVVLGLGQATLTSVNGATPMQVADTQGIIVAGLTFDAGTKQSSALLRVGAPDTHGWWAWDGRGHWKGQNDPITLSDVYFRVGGAHVGKVTTALEVNADGVVIDNAWIWRADHGEEGFTQGVNGDTDRWKTNIGTNGIVVNGDDVTATGLFAEHFQKYNSLWNGENGRVVFFQNELPYDPPTQADWTQSNGTLGYAGYTVSSKVKHHELDGGGVYVFNENNPSIVTANGFQVPQTPGVKLHHVLTVNLNGGLIQNVVNGVGGPATTAAVGTPQFVVDYPTP